MTVTVLVLKGLLELVRIYGLRDDVVDVYLYEHPMVDRSVVERVWHRLKTMLKENNYYKPGIIVETP